MSDYIPESIQFIIIKKLSLEILLRFRCVCKNWKEFIDSPSLTLHLLTLQKPQFLVKTELEFLALDIDTLPLTHTFDEPFDNQIPQLILIGTLHGIICLFHRLTNQFLLWNPSIRKLSSLDCSSDFTATLHVARARCHGFWIDPSTREYKILYLGFFMGEDSVMSNTGFLYSSVHNRCRKVSADNNWYTFEVFNVALMIGSVAYWAGKSSPEPDQATILAFDLQKECFHSIQMPIQEFTSGICVWEGSLCVMNWSLDPPQRCNLYSRQQGSWVHLFGFNLAPQVEHVYTILEGMEGRGVTLATEWDDGFQLVLNSSESPSVRLTNPDYYVVVAPGFVESLLYV